MSAKHPSEFEKFDDAMTRLLKVTHSELKVTLDAEKAVKEKKRKAKLSALGLASHDRD